MSNIARNIVCHNRSPTAYTLPQAADLIFTTLKQSGPLTWKELWSASVGPVEKEEIKVEEVKGRGRKSVAKETVKGKKARFAAGPSIAPAPKGHPFQHPRYFKDNILETLASQGVLQKIHITRPSSVPPSSDLRSSLVLRKLSKYYARSAPPSSAAISGATGSTSEFVWTLPLPLLPSSSSSSTPSPEAAEQTSFLENTVSTILSSTSAHDLALLSRARRTREESHTSLLRLSQIARKIARPGQERELYTPQDILAMPVQTVGTTSLPGNKVHPKDEGRKEWLTVWQERAHLNKRRAGGRSKKERVQQGWWDGLLLQKAQKEQVRKEQLEKEMTL